jgi:hypothetical protein
MPHEPFEARPRSRRNDSAVVRVPPRFPAFLHNPVSVAIRIREGWRDCIGQHLRLDWNFDYELVKPPGFVLIANLPGVSIRPGASIDLNLNLVARATWPRRPRP